MSGIHSTKECRRTPTARTTTWWLPTIRFRRWKRSSSGWKNKMMRSQEFESNWLKLTQWMTKAQSRKLWNRKTYFLRNTYILALFCFFMNDLKGEIRGPYWLFHKDYFWFKVILEKLITVKMIRFPQKYIAHLRTRIKTNISLPTSILFNWSFLQYVKNLFV